MPIHRTDWRNFRQHLADSEARDTDPRCVMCWRERTAQALIGRTGGRDAIVISLCRPHSVFVLKVVATPAGLKELEERLSEIILK